MTPLERLLRTLISLRWTEEEICTLLSRVNQEKLRRCIDEIREMAMASSR